MNRLDHTRNNKLIRKNRVRNTVIGTAERPRMSVHISNRHVSVQVIDDATGKTLVSATTVGNKAATGSLTELSTLIGTEIAKKATKAKISKVVLDRNGRSYQQRLNALATAARENGLEF
jgi:large subunit ribosomal protein L18